MSKVTPPFSRTYVDAAGCPFTWWSGIVADLIFWKKNLKFFILSGSRPGTSSTWFSGSARFAACSSSCYPWVFNFLAWKPFHMVNLTLKIHFWGQISHLKWFSGQKVEYPRITSTQTCRKTCWAWKPSWACTWLWPWQNKKFQIFFSKYQIRHNTRSPRERTACCVNICPRKGGCYFWH